MEKNPYETPLDDGQRAPEPMRDSIGFRFDWLYIPLAWAVLLFIIWTQHGMLQQASPSVEAIPAYPYPPAAICVWIAVFRRVLLDLL